VAKDSVTESAAAEEGSGNKGEDGGAYVAKADGLKASQENESDEAVLHTESSQASATEPLVEEVSLYDLKKEEMQDIIEKNSSVKLELPLSSGVNLFAGNVYSAKNLKIHFLDEKKMMASSYNFDDECWEKELEASYSFNAANAKLYIKVDSVYDKGKKISSAKELYSSLWPSVKKNCKKYLGESNFDSSSKKNFMNYSMQNLRNSTQARFQNLLTFSYKFSKDGKKLELNSPLETALSEVSKGQIIGFDKSGRIQLAFSNLTVQILNMDSPSNTSSESFYLGNCVFDEGEKKIMAQMFRVSQSVKNSNTVYDSMQKAGFFEATYTVTKKTNKFAMKQRFSVYDGLYSFNVSFMPEGLPELKKIEIPVHLRADKYILKKE